MQKCFDCDYDNAIIKCATCKCYLCVQCNAKKHCLSAKTIAQTNSIMTVMTKTADRDRCQNHKYFLVCEECDQREREFYCQECDEKFCGVCFGAFHKRGNRKHHERHPLNHRENFSILLNLVFFDCSKNYDKKFEKLITDYLANYKYLLKHVMIVTNNKADLEDRIDNAFFLEIVEIAAPDFFDKIEVFKGECEKLIKADYNVNKVHMFFDHDEEFTNWLIERYRDVKVNKMSSVVSEDDASGGRVGSNMDEITEMKTQWDMRMSLKSENITKYHVPPDKRINKCFSADNQEVSPNRICNYSRLSNLLESSNITEFLKHPIKHPLYHIFNDIDYDDEYFKQYSLIIQQELHENALNGNTKILYDRFILYIQNKYEISLPKIQALISKAVDSNIIYKQVRQLSNSHTLTFLSLKSSFLFSHENFLWIIKSLKKDKVSFSLSMILNRIRDVFDLSVNEEFLYDLFDDYIQYKFTVESDNDSLFKCLDIVKVSDKNYSIYYLDEHEQFTTVLEPCNSKEDFEDLIEVSEESYEFSMFKNFIDHLFTLDLIHINEKYQQITNETLSEIMRSEEGSRKTRTSQMYKLSSIDPSYVNTETIVPSKTLKFEFPHKPQQSYRNSNFATYSQNLDRQSEANTKNKHVQEKNDKPVSALKRFKKVIPGGKYGLALFTKFFGFQKLRNFSIGKILAFIDKAIKCNIIRYSKTFIFKNEDCNFSDEDSQQYADKDKLFERLRLRLIAVLQENEGQIMIAQAKELIEKTGEVYIHEFEKFGFNKVKNIIKCYNDEFPIQEVKKGTFVITWNNPEFKLVNRRIEQIASGQETRSQKKNKKKKMKKLTGNSPAQTTNLVNMSIKDSTDKSIFSNANVREMPNELLYKLKVNTFRILNSAQLGLEPADIENELHLKYNMNFNARAFGYENFYHFIINELKDIVEIEVKYLETGDCQYLIYLRNKKFGVMNKDKYMITNKLSMSKNNTCVQLSQNELEILEDKFLNNIMHEHINESSISEIQGSRTSFCMENVSQQVSYKSLIDKLKAEKVSCMKDNKDETVNKLVPGYSLSEQVDQLTGEATHRAFTNKQSGTIDSNALALEEMYGDDNKSVN